MRHQQMRVVLKHAANPMSIQRDWLPPASHVQCTGPGTDDSPSRPSSQLLSGSHADLLALLERVSYGERALAADLNSRPQANGGGSGGGSAVNGVAERPMTGAEQRAAGGRTVEIFEFHTGGLRRGVAVAAAVAGGEGDLAPRWA